MGENILEIQNITKTFPLRKKTGLLTSSKEKMIAVSDFSFHIKEGEAYSLVGESGCGKSTTGRAIVGLHEVDKGSIIYNGTDLCRLNEKDFRYLRQEIQMVFQDTLSALNPRKRIGNVLEDILKLHGLKDAGLRREKAVDTLIQVGLSEEHYFRYPHELSGGQIQRVGIACALIINPKLIVCDEPVSALDVSVQAQILNMLVDLQRKLGLSLLFISHDIGVVRFISDRIGVMYLGTMMEEADTEELFANPKHPYTKALFEATPDLYSEEKGFATLKGEQPVRTKDFKGCAFCSRCPYAMEKCQEEAPKLQEISKGHKVACYIV